VLAASTAPAGVIYGFTNAPLVSFHIIHIWHSPLDKICRKSFDKVLTLHD